MKPVSNLRLLQVAIQYFTRLPVPAIDDFDSAWLTASARFFPWVGLIIGGLTALIYFALGQVIDQSLAALLALLASVAMTGAFHEDGLADTFDALGGVVSRERALTIMRDSRIGTYGSLALIATITIRWQALASLPLLIGACMLPIVHSAARLAAASVMMSLNYVRDDDPGAKAKPVAQHLSMQNFLIGAIALSVAIVPLVIWLRVWLVPLSLALLAVVITRYVCVGWFSRRLGGYTGDSLGACEQLAEIAFLLGLLIAARVLL